MCLLLRKPALFRLVLGIITVFILCLPEFFKIHEANTVIVSCTDICSSNNTTFPICTFNNSCKTSVQQGRENQTILLKAIVNNSNFQNIPCICQSSRREQQPHTKFMECESERDVNIDHQGSGSVVKKISNKEVEHNTYYLMIIHLNNSIIRGGNAAEEHLNHSCLVAMMEEQNDCINISLQLKSYVEFVIYKIVQENRRNHYRHRVATSVSAILRQKDSRHARRTTSTTKLHPFPVQTRKQRIPLTAQTTKILPVIPEQEHCPVDQL
ncbi:transmembrane protein 156 isoform X2 [Pithys albifrons albifrons]|uniref:transmembrane protein 156 isoform X2 n=1 Tax=Pithys albifrons albifrons TaxID=3385563 RepID=UPI003A5CC695